MIEFGQPLWFWGLLLIPVLLVIFIRNEHQRARLLQKLVAARLAANLAGTVSVWKRRLQFALLLLGLACVIVSMTQPRWGYSWQERKTRGRNVLIAIDVSRSMLANDLAPTRLTRAKLAAEDLIGQLGGDRVGLIAFAGSSFLQAPLTADHSAVLASLHELEPGIIPVGGTNIADAVQTAVEAFGKGESDSRALVIFTDGEELDADALKVASEQKENVKIFTVGVGSTEGTVIALPGRIGNTDYVRDPQGQIVKSRLDEEKLRAIANATGGFYLHLQNGPAEMRQLARDGIASMNEQDVSAEFARQPIERYQWPLGAGIAVLIASMLVGERKKSAARLSSRVPLAAAWTVTLFVAGSVHAETPNELYEKGHFKEAQEAYEKLLKQNPESERLAFNHGAAAYKNGDYGAALESFGKALASEDRDLRARAEYNLGNTLFQQGFSSKEGPNIKSLESALSHYDQARKLKPSDQNAQYNYDVTQQAIAFLKQQQQQQKQKDQQKQDQKKEKDEENKDQQQQQQQQQQQGGEKEEKGEEKDPSKSDQQQQQEGQKEQKGQQNENGEGQSPKDAEKDGDQKGTEKKDGSDPQKQDKEQEGKTGDKDQNERQKSQDARSQQNGKEGEQSSVPENMPEQPDRKLEGELKNNPQPGEESKESREQKEAAEEALAASQGRMTESQAKALLDSLKNEDRNVRLWQPDKRQRERPSRDW